MRCTSSMSKPPLASAWACNLPSAIAARASLGPDVNKTGLILEFRLWAIAAKKCVLPTPGTPKSTSGLYIDPGLETTAVPAAWANRLKGPTTRISNVCRASGMSSAESDGGGKEVSTGVAVSMTASGRDGALTGDGEVGSGGFTDIGAGAGVGGGVSRDTAAERGT